MDTKIELNLGDGAPILEHDEVCFINAYVSACEKYDFLDLGHFGQKLNSLNIANYSFTEWVEIVKTQLSEIGEVIRGLHISQYEEIPVVPFQYLPYLMNSLFPGYWEKIYSITDFIFGHSFAWRELPDKQRVWITLLALDSNIHN